MDQAMRRRFLEKRRVLQDLVLVAFAGEDIPRRKEITYFLVSVVVFVAVSVLLLIRNPDHGLHTGTAYYMFHQMFTQFANGNPAIGLTANWLIYGNMDYAINALLLPSFVFGSVVPAEYVPLAVFAGWSVELFVAVYVSMRLFGLPVYVAQIGAWLAPLLAMPYVYPRIVHVELLVEDPILFTLTCVFVLSVAFFHRLGKPRAGSDKPAGIGGILVTTAILFALGSHMTLAYMSFMVSAAFSIIWPCLGLLLIASTRREAAVKVIAVAAIGVAFYFLYFDFVKGFYNYNLQDMVGGSDRDFLFPFQKLYEDLSGMLTSADQFSKRFSTQNFHMYRNAPGDPFIALFFFGSILSALFVTVLFHGRKSSPVYPSSVTFLGLLAVYTVGAMFSGYIDIMAYPFFLISFVLGVVILSRLAAGAFSKSAKYQTLAMAGILGIFFFAFAGFFVVRVEANPSYYNLYQFGKVPKLEAFAIVNEEIGINRSTLFRGRLANMAFIDLPRNHVLYPQYHDKELRDVFNMQQTADQEQVPRDRPGSGSDFRRTAVQERIPILFDINRYTSAATIAPISYFIMGTDDLLFENIQMVSKFDRKWFEFFGLRFVLTSEPLAEEPGVVFRSKAFITNRLTLYLYELSGANAGNYSPVRQVVAATGRESLDAMADRDFDFRQSVVVRGAIPGPLVPARKARVSIIDNALVFEGESSGKSIAVLPFEFSNCLRVTSPGGRPRDAPKIFRANFHQIGVLFEGKAEAKIRFHYSPFDNSGCRLRDGADLKAMKITELASYRGKKLNGGRVQ
jgi:hypothetical protein